MEPRIIFEDDWILVVDKPAGMVVNRAQTVKELTVQEWFENRNRISELEMGDLEFGQKGGIVHRLDRDTSGVMVLAKTPQAYEKLKNQFLERKVSKTYTAVVAGKLKPPQGVVAIPVVRHPVVRGKFAVGENLSRMAVTEWQVTGEFAAAGQSYSRVDLYPKTGRTHQLRVHLKHLGYPIAGDALYRGRKQLRSDRQWCPRMWLHARTLAFVHPQTGERVEFTADLPRELAESLSRAQA